MCEASGFLFFFVLCCCCFVVGEIIVMSVHVSVWMCAYVCMLWWVDKCACMHACVRVCMHVLCESSFTLLDLFPELVLCVGVTCKQFWLYGWRYRHGLQHTFWLANVSTLQHA